MKKIVQDVRSGALPREEVPGFVWYIIRKAFEVLFWAAVLATVLWMIVN